MSWTHVRIRPLIKAYHQIGTDAMEPGERRELFDRILEIGEILPATERVKQSEMWNECFSERESQVQTLSGRFHMATLKALLALEEIARERVERLPGEGTTHTLFNCVDVLAGDLGRIFLSVGNWYQDIPNGLIYESEGLLLKGARFRPKDLLGSFEEAIAEAVHHRYKTVREARNLIESMLTSVIDSESFEGKDGVRTLRKCQKIEDGCPWGEIVWEGSLPVGWATEAWREGKLVWSRELLKGVK